MPVFNADKHYWGNPCARGHDGLRRIKGGDCVWCSLERSRKWSKRNPDKARESQRRSIKKNPEIQRRNVRNYSKRHPERVRETYRRWVKNNPEYHREWRRNHPEVRQRYYQNNKHKYIEGCNKRRASKKQATPSWYEKDKCEMVYQRAKEMGSTVDHIVPLQSDVVCGLHCWDNLQILPDDENKKKGNKYWPDGPDDKLINDDRKQVESYFQRVFSEIKL